MKIILLFSSENENFTFFVNDEINGKFTMAEKQIGIFVILSLGCRFIWPNVVPTINSK